MAHLSWPLTTVTFMRIERKITMIWVVNFPFCNFFSLERYFRIRSRPFQILTKADKPSPNDIIILPGVGTFGKGMDFLRTSCLDILIKNHAGLGGNVVGICLGMQILLEESSESPGVIGLGLIEGTCELIPATPSFSVPHVGWNALVFPESVHSRFVTFGKPMGLSISDYYFVHSYYACTKYHGSVVAAFAHPSGMLAAAISIGSVMGLQFHPEKSGPAGYSLLDKILTL